MIMLWISSQGSNSNYDKYSCGVYYYQWIVSNMEDVKEQTLDMFRKTLNITENNSSYLSTCKIRSSLPSIPQDCSQDKESLEKVS